MTSLGGYMAPLRCHHCGTAINKKQGAKTPKYCPPCRQQLQADWKKQLRQRAGNRRSD